ncbi:DNA-binding response regulator [Paenibacillus baekrokdamisoli]|uniref:DNA-binding response regulator n=1 Tax=Paenibacillus baekrokdamisoli TaxID=1712516 RepID=A0A3G9JI96_9BACL|nr:response regulator transcription factor [Paenibacillus baekrokdamisoli]MBB3071281.1 DNA-binding response OmpR family regulator [Paenibacillus baekrokdamisoli]BBH24683.1 DNA-binding response regulator [Paenibacillus baekrokdamisoli]
MDKPVHILVVEDDNDLNHLLCSILRKSGYVPQSAYSGTEALLYLEKQEWNMVLLDLMLPGKTGEELLHILSQRKESIQMPVIIISAKGEQQTKIAALRGGADDFITKPFDIEEVSARIDSHLRRYKRIPAEARSNKLQHKTITLDQDAQTVHIQGIEVTFTSREFDILALLLSSPKKIFTKANVYESVWGEPYFGDDNTINVHVSNLRSKLAKASPNEEFIETVWGMGYRLKA